MVSGTVVGFNEDRLAARDIDNELTTLAQGVAAEQHDLNLDALNEWLSAALALSPRGGPATFVAGSRNDRMPRHAYPNSPPKFL